MSLNRWCHNSHHVYVNCHIFIVLLQFYNLKNVQFMKNLKFSVWCRKSRWKVDLKLFYIRMKLSLRFLFFSTVKSIIEPDYSWLNYAEPSILLLFGQIVLLDCDIMADLQGDWNRVGDGFLELKCWLSKTSIIGDKAIMSLLDVKRLQKLI